MRAREAILEARNLGKDFHAGGALSRQVVKAVQEASVKLYPGHVTALVGESGSGKSTLARMLAQLYKPTRGEILFRGKNVLEGRGRKKELDYRNRVQMIFQDPFSSLNPVHQVHHPLRRALKIHGKKGDSKALLSLLERVALTPVEDFINKHPHQLSGGQRQRIAIARALAVEPDVILADEPISMLDVSIRMGVSNLMARLRDDFNIAFLYVTHDLASARYFADDTLVMYAGRIVEAAPSETLVQDPKHPYTQLLLSAVPDPERGLRTDTVEAEGEVPNLTEIGPGCPFAPRCPQVMTRCRDAMPPVTTLSAERWTRCYLYEPSTENGSRPAATPSSGD